MTIQDQDEDEECNCEACIEDEQQREAALQLVDDFLLACTDSFLMSAEQAAAAMFEVFHTTPSEAGEYYSRCLEVEGMRSSEAAMATIATWFLPHNVHAVPTIPVPA